MNETTGGPIGGGKLIAPVPFGCSATRLFAMARNLSKGEES